MIVKSDPEIWRKTNLLFQKWQEFGEFWSEHSKVSKTCSVIGLFCAKRITFDLKKYRGIIFHDTEESCNIWRTNDLWFGKWYEELGKFSPEHLKVSKLGLRWDPFVQSWECMSLKFTWELCVMAMKNNANLKRNWLVSSKLTRVWRIWWVLPRALEHLKNVHFNELLLTKVYNVWAKKST